MDNVQKLETKYHKLERLCKWEHVAEVNQMLLEGKTPVKVAVWCKEHGFDISHPKLYEYKELLQAAIAKNVTVERILGIGQPKRNPILLQALGVVEAKDIVKHELEVLDAIIQKGYSSILSNVDIKLSDAMKAIELKNKITGGAHGGLTGAGLDQLRELEQAKFTAILEVVLQYLPEDKHAELQQAIQTAERNFYKERAPELLEQYDAQMQVDLDATENKVPAKAKGVS